MNKKAQEIGGLGTVGKAILLLLLFVFVAFIIGKFIPGPMENFLDSVRRFGDDYIKPIFGRSIFAEEELLEIELSALPEDYQPAFKGIYQALKDGKASQDEECLIEYPEMTNLKRNALAFEAFTKDEEGNTLSKNKQGLKMLFIDEQGKKLRIQGFEPITGLMPCFIAGKTEEGQVVAENLYKYWLEGEEWQEPGYIVGNVKMVNKDSGSPVPDTLQVTGESEINKGKTYHIRYNPTILYKVDAEHICFMPEKHGKQFELGVQLGLTPLCNGDEEGLYKGCFEHDEIRRIPVCTVEEENE